jgi:hypothetical protein
LLQGDVLLRRRFVTETFCRGDVLLGDVLSRRRFVRRPFVCASLRHCTSNGTVGPVRYVCTIRGGQSYFKK